MSAWEVTFEPSGPVTRIDARPPHMSWATQVALSDCQTAPCVEIFEIPDEWGCAQITGRTIDPGECTVDGDPIPEGALHADAVCSPTGVSEASTWIDVGVCPDPPLQPVPEFGFYAGLFAGVFLLSALANFAARRL